MYIHTSLLPTFQSVELLHGIGSGYVIEFIVAMFHCLALCYNTLYTSLASRRIVLSKR